MESRVYQNQRSENQNPKKRSFLRRVSVVVALAGALLSGISGSHAQKKGKGGFVPLPPLKGRSSKLQIKFKAYKGGKVVAEVKNTTKTAQAFHPAGMFFVPTDHPDKAPQRMGAAGPYEVYDGSAWHPVTKSYKIPKGKNVQVRLQVFCLDHHRASPQNGQGFRVAKMRLPKNLQHRIRKGVTKALGGRRSYKGAPRAKGAVQSHIWNERARKWYKIEGEGSQEKSRKNRQLRNQRIRQQRIPRGQRQMRRSPAKVHKNPFLNSSK